MISKISIETLIKNLDRGSGCTGLVIGKHGDLSLAFLRILDLITKSLLNQHFNYYCIVPLFA
jgi:hypothetical protein